MLVALFVPSVNVVKLEQFIKHSPLIELVELGIDIVVNDVHPLKDPV